MWGERRAGRVRFLEVLVAVLGFLCESGLAAGALARTRAGAITWGAAFACIIFSPAPAFSQQRTTAQPLQLDRERLPLPDLEAEPQRPPSLELPGLESLPESSPLDAATGFVASGFRLVGATVFSEAELSAALAPFLGRALRSEDLPSVADAVTRLYIEGGYLSSGARIPDQSVDSGIIEVHIVEGALPELVIEEGGRLRPHFVEDRVWRGLRAPLNLDALERSLRLLQMDPRIDRVDAVLLPGELPGASVLRLDVTEANPWEIDFRLANDLAPSLGENRASATILNRNVLGLGDQFRGVVSGAQGLFDLDLAYSVPFTPWLTELEIRGGLSRGKVVEGDFANQFRNEIESYGAALTQPLYVTLEDRVRGRVEFERRTSQLSFDGGDGLALETKVDDEGEIHLSLLRIALEWVHRETDRVFAAQLRTTFGLDVWDATTPNDTLAAQEPTSALPDGEFTSWLMQFQYAQRIGTPLGDAELIARGDVQVATGALFSLESFAMGGASTVRGYLENSIVSDNGMLASIEFRVPIMPDRFRPHEIRLAPFFDTGYAWDDHDRHTRDFDRWFGGIGFGVLYRYAERFELNAYWGRALRSRGTNLEGKTQRHGFHLEARLAVF